MENRYWVGGTGNWSDNTNHWSTSSGGAPGASKPTESDDAIFDANSHNDDYTVTIDKASTCKDFIMDKPTGDGKKVTWAGTSSLTISGNLTLTGGTDGITRTYTGNIAMNATSGTKTILSNGVSLGGGFLINGDGGTFQLSDDFSIVMSAAQQFSRNVGIFDANGKSVTITGTNELISGTFTGVNAFYNLIRIGAANKVSTFTLSANIKVTNNLTISGNSTTERVLVKSNVIGAPITIDITDTTGNSFSNVDFRDITMVTGGADLDLSAITGGSGDCGGNDGITFTDSADQHWTNADGGSWSTAANWTSRVPLPQDDVYMDCAFNASKTVTADMLRLGRSISWAGATGSPTWTTSTAASIFGSLDLTDLGTLTASTQSYTFEGRGNYTLTSAGKEWAKIIAINNFGGTLSLGSDFISTTGLRQYNRSGFDANDKNVTCEYFRHSSVTSGTLSMGSGTWTITGVGTGASAAFAPGLLTTLNAENSTIKFTSTANDAITFAGGSKTYNNVWFARGASTGNIIITGSNTFAELKDDGSESHNLISTAGTTQTGTTPGWFKVNGSTTGKEIILNSTTTEVFNLVNAGGGVVSCDYLDIQHCVATPLNSWYAGANSINNQSVATAGSGWIFSTPPSASTIATNRGRNRFKFTPISQG